MPLRPPRIVPARRASDDLTRWERFLMSTCHPTSALRKRAKERGVWFDVLTADAVPQAVDEESTAPYTVS